jgi:BirA family biotin operon repressor/biotin-[acetyl-CoA-carboxylase] ligase
MTHLHFRCLSSTNTYLKELVEKYPVKELPSFLPPFFAVTADKQELGRGRQGKKWESETGKNLLLSLLLYPNIHPAKQFNICQYVSLAMIDLLKDTFSIPHVNIKWPNDIYAGHKKMAGILIEHFIQGNVINYTIAGIGMNINQRIFPATLPNASSLYLETGQEHDIKECMENLIANIKQIEKLPGTVLKERYERCLYRKGEFANYILPTISDTPMSLQITGVSATGQLELLDQSHTPYSCAFNEVIYLEN